MSEAPHNSQSSHHIRLTYSTTEVPLILCKDNGDEDPTAFHRAPMPRNSLKTYQDEQTYSDLEPPWTPISMTNWSGGRGSANLDKDATKYHDSLGINPSKEGILMLAGMPIFTSGYNTSSQNWWPWASPTTSDDLSYPGLETGSLTFDKTISLSSGAYTHLYVVMSANWGTSDTPPGTVTIDLGTDSGGSYGTTLATGTLAAPNGSTYLPGAFYIHKITFASATGTISGTHHIRFTAASADNGSYWLIVSMAASGYNPIIRLCTADDDFKAHFFDYKGARYAALTYNGASYSKLFVNGDHGVAKSGSTTTSVTLDSGVATWSENLAYGSVMVISSGTGAQQSRATSVITGNTATAAGETTFTVSFDVAPAAGDIIAIVNCPVWTEVTGFDTNYDVKVTDVLSANGAVYFACGDSAIMLRMYAYNNAGTWTYNYSDLGSYTAGSVAETGQYTHLRLATDEAGTYVWGGKLATGVAGYATAIDATAWAGSGESALSFTDVTIGDKQIGINGLDTFGEYGNLVVLKPNKTFNVINKKPFEISIREMNAATDSRNGKAHCVQGVYLYQSFHNGVTRYFDGILDRIGMDKDDIPIKYYRIGPVSSLTGYPGTVFAAVDGGPSKFSSLLAYNEQGWYEVFRAPAIGDRIQSLSVQPIDGDTADLLWFSCGSNIICMPIAIDPMEHLGASGTTFYPFTWGGHIVTPWIYAGLQNVQKYFDRITISQKYIDAQAIGQYHIYYRTTENSSWQFAGVTVADALPIGSTAIPSLNGVDISDAARGIQFLIVIRPYGVLSIKVGHTPEITSILVDCITRVPVKWQTTIRFRVEDYAGGQNGTDLLGHPDPYLTSDAKITALENLIGTPFPVTITSVSKQLNGKTGWVDSMSLSPYRMKFKNGNEGYVGTLTIIER